MKILDPQSAILSNVEVLAHFTQNPPRRPPNPPPNANAKNFTPNPDLRDHNTVVKEFHDYVSRLSPHLLKYPSFNASTSTSPSASVVPAATATATAETNNDESAPLTQLDAALRDLISRLKPFQLTKAEVLTMLNLGVGLDAADKGQEGDGNGDGDGDGAGAATAEEEEEEGGGGDTVMQDGEEDDYGAMAILNSVIEDRAERLTDEDVLQTLAILRETLWGLKRSEGASDDAG